MRQSVLNGLAVLILLIFIGNSRSYAVDYCITAPCCYDKYVQPGQEVKEDERDLLLPQNQIRSIGCRRSFEYRGRLMPLDSKHRRDANGLRPIFQRSPGALQLLTEYQENQNNVRLAAYTGTIGVIVAVAGLILKSQTEGPKLNALKNGLFFGGGAIALGSLGYSLTLQTSNEGKLRGAVDQYNQQYPEDEFRLNFETGILF